MVTAHQDEKWPYHFCENCGYLVPVKYVLRDSATRAAKCLVCGQELDQRNKGRVVLLTVDEAQLRQLPYFTAEQTDEEEE